MKKIIYILIIVNFISCKRAQTKKVDYLIIDTTMSIKEGFKSLKEKDTLYLKGGIYREMINNFIPNGKTLSGYKDEIVIIKPDSFAHPSGLGLRFSGNKESCMGINVTLKNLIIDGTNLTNSVIKFTDSAYGGKLINVEVKNGFFNGILINEGADSIQIKDCYVHSIGVNKHIINGKWSHGIYIASSNSSVTNTRIDSVSGWGVHIYGSSSNPQDYNNIEDNVISNAGLSGHGAGIILSRGRGHHAKGNLILNSPVGIHVRYGGVKSTLEGNKIKNCDVGLMIDQNLSPNLKNNTIMNSRIKIQKIKL